MKLIDHFMMNTFYKIVVEKNVTQNMCKQIQKHLQHTPLLKKLLRTYPKIVLLVNTCACEIRVFFIFSLEYNPRGELYWL